jgi:hypothetical protein
MGDLWRKCLWQGSQSQAYKDVLTASFGTDCPCGVRIYDRIIPRCKIDAMFLDS